MAKSLGTLGDLFPDKKIQCCVRGCSSLLRLPGDKSTPLPPPDPQRPDGMCDRCYAEFQQTQDQAVPCQSAGCTRTWTWSRMQQLEARVQGNRQPPAQLCGDCQNRRRDIQDRELPCKVKGCNRTFLWTRDEQWRDGSDNPPSRLCPDCVLDLRDLSDREVSCRISGCTHTWPWGRYQQLEHLLAGKKLDDPPRRMCRDCLDKVKALQDSPLPCKVKGCGKSWQFTAFSQLEWLLTRGPEEAPPLKMCPECFQHFNASKDVQVPCRHRGCSHAWTYGRHAQLLDRAAGRKQAPARLCQSCAEAIKKNPDVDVPCAVPGCHNSWKYAAADQVKDRCQGKHSPTDRRCATCDEFLATVEPKNVPCARCSQDFPWSTYEQLLCKLGTFATPTRCASCAEQELSLQRPAAPPIHRQNRQVVRMPAGGRWNVDPALVHWPPHLTSDVLAAVQHADLRIVALGDDLTYSSDSRADAWPALLEKRLNDELAGKAKVAVVNAGMPRTGSHQALVRWPRDVEPFSPHLIIASFAFADSLLDLNRHERAWHPLIAPETAAAGMNSLFPKLAGCGAKLLCWTTNPILATDWAESALGPEFMPWAIAEEAAHSQCVGHILRLCNNHHVPVLDLRSRFEVNGKKSARKWMSDWFNHNPAGAQNIALWMAEYILREKLLPVEGVTHD